MRSCISSGNSRTRAALSFFNPFILQEGRGQQSLSAGSVFEQMPTIWEHVHRNLRGSNEKSRPNLIIATLGHSEGKRTQKMPGGWGSKGDSHCTSGRAQTHPNPGRPGPPLLFLMRHKNLPARKNWTAELPHLSLHWDDKKNPTKKPKTLVNFNRHHNVPKIHHLLAACASAGSSRGVA